MPSAHKVTEAAFPCPAPDFASFTTLPREIADRIIILACRSPEQSCNDAELEKRSIFALDLNTTSNLTQVSKSVSETALSALYETLRVTKPSALVELHATLKARPELAKKIKNLHIGAKDNLPVSKWPFQTAYDSFGGHLSSAKLRLRTFLIDQKLRPRWCSGDDRSWPMEEERGRAMNASHLAIVRAIESALKHVDLDPYKREYGKSGSRIGLELWFVRTFEVQACLDLYLIELRRIDDATSGYEDPTYPRLVVSGFSSAPSKAAKTNAERGNHAQDIFVITRAQLWKHLTRPGSTLDQFEHPFLFARTGLDSMSLNEYGRGIISKYLVGPEPEMFGVEGIDTTPQQEDLISREQSVIEAQGLAPGFTIPALLAAATDVISKATNLDNLSLLGSFYHCLSTPELRLSTTLRSLGLGPLFPVWEEGSIIASCSAKLGNLESLRVCGGFIDEDEAKQVAGRVDGCLPKLKRFQWEVIEAWAPHEQPEISPQDLLSLIRPLQGQGEPLSNNSKLSSIERLRGLHLRQQQPDTDLSSRLIELRLHPKTYKDFLGRVSRATREAWKTGKMLAPHDGAPNRIKISESEAAKCKAEGLEVGTKRLHSDARGWFEECATLGKGGGKAMGKEEEPGSGAAGANKGRGS